MSASQYIILVVDREGRWLPIWGRRVAKLAVRWDSERNVVRVRASVVVRRMAAVASIRRVVVIAVVAGRAIVGDRGADDYKGGIQAVLNRSCGARR